jgi:hypothetical protein
MSNETKKTAVDWLISKVNKQSWGDFRIDIPNEIIEQAKEKEKEQIAKAFDDGDYNYHYSRKTGNDFEDGIDYYNETYGGNK